MPRPPPTTTTTTARRFFVEILDIPRLPERLNCLVQARSFAATASRVEGQLELLNGGAAELKGCSDFGLVLSQVLAVGNHLNTGALRGDLESGCAVQTPTERALDVGAALGTLHHRTYKKHTHGNVNSDHCFIYFKT